MFNSIQDLEKEILKLDKKNNFSVFENGDRSVSCALQPFVVASCQTGEPYKRAKGGQKRDQNGIYVVPIEDTGKIVVACLK